MFDCCIRNAWALLHSLFVDAPYITMKDLRETDTLALVSVRNCNNLKVCYVRFDTCFSVKVGIPPPSVWTSVYVLV